MVFFQIIKKIIVPILLNDWLHTFSCSPQLTIYQFLFALCFVRNVDTAGNLSLLAASLGGLTASTIIVFSIIQTVLTDAEWCIKLQTISCEETSCCCNTCQACLPTLYNWWEVNSAKDLRVLDQKIKAFSCSF